MKEPYRSQFMEYAKGCQEARKLFLDAFPWFMDVAKSTCALKKKGNVEGTAFSYLLQTVEDVVLEDVRLYFLSLQNRKREFFYTLQALIFDGLQLIPSEFADFNKDIINAMIRKNTVGSISICNWSPLTVFTCHRMEIMEGQMRPSKRTFWRSSTKILLSFPLESHQLWLKLKQEIMRLRKLRLQFEVGLLKKLKEQFSQHKIGQWRIVASRLCHMLQCGWVQNK